MSIGPLVLLAIAVSIAILGGLAVSRAISRHLGDNDGQLDSAIGRRNGYIAADDIIILLGIVSVAVFFFSRIQGQYPLLLMGGICIAAGIIWKVFFRR